MKKLLFIACIGLSLASCTTNRGYISDANAQLQLKRDDLELTKQINTEVKQTLIFGIDFKRLFKADVAVINQPQSGTYNGGIVGGGIPILGGLLGLRSGTAKVELYAYAKLLADNPGYDCIVYPRYNQKTKNILGIVVKTTGKLDVRLGKIK